MVESLELDDDLDPVEVIQLIEKAFDVEFTDTEVKDILTVGQMQDLLLSKVPLGNVNRKCASAMAFYRLRSALVDLRGEDNISPSFELSNVVRAKRFLKMLGARTGLNMPRPAYSWIGNTGGYVALAWLLGIVALIICEVTRISVPEILSLYCWLALPAAYALGVLDPGQLPKDCRTVGGLARKVATLSFGILAKQGARSTEQAVWTALVEVLSGWSEIPAGEIVRDTYFLQMELIRSA